LLRAVPQVMAASFPAAFDSDQMRKSRI
jgi:hypothetical protein